MTHSVNNVDKVEVAIAKVGELNKTQQDALNKMIEREGKFDALIEKVEKLDVETKQMKQEVNAAI